MNGQQQQQQQHPHHQPAASTQQQQWVLMPAHAAAAASMAQQHQPMGLTVASCDAMSELQGGGGGMMMRMSAVQYGHQQQQGGYAQQQQLPQSHGMAAGGQMHLGGPGGMHMGGMGGLQHQQQHMQQNHHQQQYGGGGVLWSDVPGMRPGGGGARGPGGMMGGQHPLALNVAGHTPMMAKASSVEELLQLLRRPPPPGMSVIDIVRDSLQYLDSRALAALLKELSKTGRRDTAFQIFNWLRDPGQSMDPAYAGLLDVFTYTTMIVSAGGVIYMTGQPGLMVVCWLVLGCSLSRTVPCSRLTPSARRLCLAPCLPAAGPVHEPHAAGHRTGADG
jgi:hypothetical protein